MKKFELKLKAASASIQPRSVQRVEVLKSKKMSEMHIKLRDLFLAKKGNLTLRQIQDESGVSYSTLSRFQYHPEKVDFDNLVRIGRWCGIEVFADNSQKVSGDTLENIRKVIEADENLDEEGRENLWNVFRACYEYLPKTKPFSGE